MVESAMFVAEFNARARSTFAATNRFSAPKHCLSAPKRSRGQSRIATALVQPAEAPFTLQGKQATWKPSTGSRSRLCSFSMWQ
jgi:hypothetical protein